MRLYPKFLLVLVPCFLLLAGVALWVERAYLTDSQTDDLAQRVGFLAGKVASSMRRHDAANSPALAQDLLAPLGHEPSVVCAEFQVAGVLTASYPNGLGCKNATFDESMDLSLGDQQQLRVALTESNINAVANAQLQRGGATLGMAFLLTLLSASIGFHYIVNRRLRNLNTAISAAVSQRTRMELCDRSSDEIGSLVASYNRLVSVENQLENELRKKNRQITEASQLDPLTGLFNRLYCQRHLEPLPPTRAGLTGFLALIDIDHFKSVNDTYGHEVGDQVLRILGARLKENLRDDSLAIRWGGEEFVVVFNEVSAELGPTLVKRILDCVRTAPFVTDAGPLDITASVGMCPSDICSSKELKSVMNWADRVLYVAKDRGRNRAGILSSPVDVHGQPLGKCLTGGDLVWVGVQNHHVAPQLAEHALEA